jgi:hypothetical protein
MHANTDRASEAARILVVAQVDELERDHAGAEPIDRAILADGIAFALERGALNPSDPPFWRSVIAELRRRHGQGRG